MIAVWLISAVVLLLRPFGLAAALTFSVSIHSGIRAGKRNEFLCSFTNKFIWMCCQLPFLTFLELQPVRVGTRIGILAPVS